MTALVDHTRDHDLTLQGNQAARSRALTHLLEIPGMPTVSTWSIDDLSDRLSGLIMAGRDDDADKQRAKVRAWAEFLHTPVVETTTDGRTTVSAECPRCEYGVPVRIWAPLRPALTEEAAA
jgi:hypothetical protein